MLLRTSGALGVPDDFSTMALSSLEQNLSLGLSGTSQNAVFLGTSECPCSGHLVMKRLV